MQHRHITDVYAVIVGNVGYVYSGDSETVARGTFGEYVSQSESAYGRASGEYVILLCNDEIIADYIGTRNDDE